MTQENTETSSTQSNKVSFTESAIEAVRNAIAAEGKPGDGLRVSVVGGGCSGYQYDSDFEKRRKNR
ncbi:MAG: hypothetical protein R3A13_12780 [Bdellovibrionota bacterium]